MNSLFPQLVSLPPMLANVSPEAEAVIGPITNSIFVALIVLGIILWVSNKATVGMTLVPHKWQNFFESIIEGLYGQVEGIVGKKVAPDAFPLLATLFIYILVSNWFGLLPGVGTIGYGETAGFPGVVTEVHTALLRPVAADLNATLGITLVVFGFWIVLTLRHAGLGHFLSHTFGAKGGLKGFMGIVMMVIFFMVGLVEVFSILLRNLTLPMRLYGNVFAGEQVLHTMSGMLDGQPAIIAFLGKILLPLPFYFMELLVGILQAMVFTLLTAVYIKLSTAHDEEHGEAHHH